jgi:lipid-binding SYLF domain-containing protein
VFPEIAKGGMLVGGAHGVGVLYERGRPAGYAELNQASIGAQLGGQTFSDIVVLNSAQALARAKSNNFDLGAGVSAIVVNEGAAAAVRFADGVAVFVLPRGGLMVDLSVHGQKINFVSQPRG